jgi:Fe2+ or Zn2+ uptake regulation protein
MNKANCHPEFRHSRQRQEVLTLLRGTTAHPTAAAIHRGLKVRLPRLSLGTVYRNLEILQQQGLVRALTGNGRETRYDAQLAPHAHFCCQSCGQVEDLPVSRSLGRLLARLARPGGRVEDVRVELFGTCRHCQRQLSIQGGTIHP